MDILSQTVDSDRGPAPLTPSVSEPATTLAELTLCLSATYAALGRLHLDLNEPDLALADLNEALRLDPDNTEAYQLRSVIEKRTGQVRSVRVTPDQSERHELAIDCGSPPPTRFQAGYQVLARYDESGNSDQPLIVVPLTDMGRFEAIEFARRMCSEESRSLRRGLYVAYWSHGEEFDVVVSEFRSLVREIHLEQAVGDDG
ncbi:Tetratricopeptide repeat-containing protein [Singulisphaera sp. GP187]|uniref:tetratricopeptide repeat protein n=1 Tax=Singulisphaera sp. GP187 TaxID=1882752 RepID=UPI000927AA21|nr:tetratricopeptide repeat protein [Singulisphaera sp. GP187]SIO63376.1 Tetratricopeptide repeat-containing protein [Singulisphaera sp. GP187]